MAKTFQDIQTGIRQYLDEAQQADFLDSEVQREANYAYQDVVGYVMEVFEKYYDTVNPLTYAIISNQQEYSISPNLIKVTRVEINYAPNIQDSQPVRAVRVNMDEIQVNLSFNDAAGPSFFNAGYYIHGAQDEQKIGFIPIPQIADTTGESISVWGIQIPDVLVNPTDVIRIPFAERFAQLIEVKAASALLRKGQQQDTAAYNYSLNYDRGIQKMQTFLKERQSEGVWMIEDVQAIDMDFQLDGGW